MLDVEIVTEAVQTGLDIVSLPEMKRHLRIPTANTALDAEIIDAINEAVDKLDGPLGELNRTILPRTWRRHLPRFPSCRVIQLPYPPLIAVESIEYFDPDGASPRPSIPDTDYQVRTGGLIGEIEFTPLSWPSTAIRTPRAVSITYTAGYTEFPPALKRLVKILAAHYLENKEATTVDARHFSRKVEFGMEDLRTALRIPVAHDGWE